MRRSLLLGVLLLVGCRLPPDIDALKPLDDKKAPPPTYGELYERARNQSNAALERFYADDWADLIDLAKGLEQTAKWMPTVKGVAADGAEALQADAAKLGDAARARNVRAANEALQRIQFNIRALRPKSD